MPNHFKILIAIFLISINSQLKSQNKIVNPTTYNNVCFYAISTNKINEFNTVRKNIESEAYKEIYKLISLMKKDLKDFKKKKLNRAYEIWYQGNYVDYKNQLNTSLESTLNQLVYYENRLRSNDALYYEHRHFLELSLSFLTEAFYKDFWFMSQERYFSIESHKRVCSDNAKGHYIFEASEFYSPCGFLNVINNKENKNTAEYLGMGNQKNKFLTHNYWVLKKKSAEDILLNFKLNDASMNVKVDREISELIKFLEAVKSDEVSLIMRTNDLPNKKNEKN